MITFFVLFVGHVDCSLLLIVLFDLITIMDCYTCIKWSVVSLLISSSIVYLIAYGLAVPLVETHLIEFHMFYLLTLFTNFFGIYGTIKERYCYLFCVIFNLISLFIMSILVNLLNLGLSIFYCLVISDVILFAICVKNCNEPDYWLTKSLILIILHLYHNNHDHQLETIS